MDRLAYVQANGVPLFLFEVFDLMIWLKSRNVDTQMSIYRRTVLTLNVRT